MRSLGLRARTLPVLLASLGAVPAVAADDPDTEFKFSGRIAYGAVYRMEARDPALLTSYNAATIGLAGTGMGPNADDANLNYARHDAVSRALLGSLELRFKRGDLRGAARVDGWRDFALPRLQERFGPLGAAAVLGPLWALWHMPLYFSDWGGWPDAHWTEPLVFALFTITFNVVITWVFNRTGESLPVVMLLHVGVNNTISTLWADMYPGMTAGTMMHGLAIVSTVAAVVLLVVTRGRLGYLRRTETARLLGSNDGTR